MSSLQPYLLAALSALALAAGWWIPASTTCAVFGWVGVFCFIALVRHRDASYGALAVCGIITNLLGFYWLFPTIKNFGGFDYFAAALIFSLFVVVSANQHLIFFFLYRRLPRFFDSAAMRLACAWIATEFFSLRIFPWSMGHTQLAFTPFIQVADLFGTPIIAFLMLWAGESVWRFLREAERRAALALPLCALLAAYMYGLSRVANFSIESAQRVPVTLIQANISTAEKRNIRYFVRNKERYEQLSAAAAKPGAIVIWPESVITDFISDEITAVAQDERLPFFGANIGLLVGALTYRSEKEIFNSAVAILPDGSIPAPYHKRVLMPFGEFTPFSHTFPWLKEINATAGEFSAGNSISIFEYRFADPHAGSVKLSPLICYEDIAPHLARDATRAGADVLVNVTNDAWFGNTAAPRQHHMIAAFRAVENKRFLLRSTNSGLTAVVDPLGRTVAELPVFSDGVLNYTIALTADSTYYTRVFGETLWWTISGLILLIGLISPALRRS